MIFYRKKKYMVLLSMVLITIAIFFYIKGKDTPEDKDKKLRQEVIQLNEELIKAERLGEKEKVAQIEKKIESRLPENLKKLVEHIKENSFDLDFYGKVVDQYGEPVVNAKINYYMSSMYNLQTNARGNVETDQAGLFNIKASGYTLSLKMPVHPMLSNKYVPGTAKAPFLSGSSILLEPSAVGRSIQSWKGYGKNKPYLIRSWRVDKFENVLHGNTLLGLSPDNKVHTFIKTKQYSKMIAKAGVHSDGDLLINCMRDPSGLEKKNGQWKVTIKAIDGGIQEATANYQVEAPDDGYLESVTITQSASKAYGASVIKNKHYYYKSHNGKVYGSLKIKFEPYLKKRYCGLFVDYVINKNSSRNLAVKK